MNTTENPSDIPPDPRQAPGFLLVHTSIRIRLGLRRALLSTGRDITPEQWGVLVTLAFEQGLSQCALGQRLVKDKATLTRILDRMEKRGLLTRKPHGRDRRSHRLYVTAEGLELRRALLPTVQAYAGEVFSGLSSEDLHTLKTLLEKINQRVPDSCSRSSQCSGD